MAFLIPIVLVIAAILAVALVNKQQGKGRSGSVGSPDQAAGQPFSAAERSFLGVLDLAVRAGAVPGGHRPMRRGRRAASLDDTLIKVAAGVIVSYAESRPILRFVYVDQAGYQRNAPTSFASLVAGFTGYQA